MDIDEIQDVLLDSNLAYLLSEKLELIAEQESQSKSLELLRQTKVDITSDLEVIISWEGEEVVICNLRSLISTDEELRKNLTAFIGEK